MPTTPEHIHTTIDTDAELYHLHDEVPVRMIVETHPAPAMSFDGPDRALIEWGRVTYRCPQCQEGRDHPLVEMVARSAGRLESSVDAKRAWFHGEGPGRKAR